MKEAVVVLIRRAEHDAKWAALFEDFGEFVEKLAMRGAQPFLGVPMLQQDDLKGFIVGLWILWFGAGTGRKSKAQNTNRVAKCVLTNPLAAPAEAFPGIPPRVTEPRG